MSMSKQESLNINQLPVEVLSKIFSYLKVRHRKISSLVCIKWRNATRCPSFYRTLRLHKGLYIDEPPLSLFQNSYHPFSVIIFEDIDEFTQDISEFWKVVTDSVRELHFMSCEGLNAEVLSMLLTHLPNVRKIKVTGTNSLSSCKLERDFENVKILDLKDTEMPAWYIEPLAQSFPNLRELNLGSYTYDGWDAHEEHLLNVSPTATNTPFGDWVKNLCKLAPKVTLTYDYEVVMRTETILKEFLEVENLEIRSLNIKIEGLSIQMLQKFIEKKGKNLQRFEIPDAHLLKIEHLALLNKNCVNLREISLRFEEETKVPVLEHLANLTKLEKIAIHGPEAEEFEYVLTTKPLEFKNLRTLVIFNAKIEGDLKNFQCLVESFPFLTELSLADCIITPEALQIIYETCKSLESLHLECNEQITDNGLFNGKSSVNDLKLLESLNLNGCVNITNQSLKKFKFKELFRLGLRDVTSVGLDGITELCRNCPTINQLDLNGCSSINDECVKVITKSLPHLLDIDLSRTAITAKSLEFIADNCLDIKNVDISYEPPGDSRAVEKLLQKRILHFLSALALNNISERLVIPGELEL
ncbi:uncharacterized protein LOC134833293 [Culicoides brevitarsis]|uniref:uncharacterized protein LOC134833293 n=1 Tax=Culicoides brevitarsis TaxID=469753 RepID=UPI00307B946D